MLAAFVLKGEYLFVWVYHTHLFVFVVIANCRTAGYVCYKALTWQVVKDNVNLHWSLNMLINPKNCLV